MCCAICDDNRFEIIKNAKKKLIESTNIESSTEEMAVIDNFLFRMWQMKWLPGCVDAVPVVHGYWMKYEVDVAEHPWHCSHCGYCPPKFVSHIDEMEYCNHCGAKMDDEGW